MPVIRRLQASKTLPLGGVRTTNVKPTFAFASPSSVLQARGLNPDQVNRALPRPAPLRGAGYSRGQSLKSATAHAAATASASINQTALRTGRALALGFAAHARPSTQSRRGNAGHGGGHGTSGRR